MIQYASLVGKKHIANNKVCEDYCKVFKVNQFGVVIVADGIGSSKHPDIASSKVVCFFEEVLRVTLLSVNEKNEVKKCLENAFDVAHQMLDTYISTYFKDLSHISFGTTLSIAIHHPEYIVYGHVGDSAILKIVGGEYHFITTQQNTEKLHQTFSFLRAKNKWEFMIVDEKTDGIIGVTDGMIDIIHHNNIINKHLIDACLFNNLALQLHFIRALNLSDDDLSLAYYKTS